MLSQLHWLHRGASHAIGASPMSSAAPLQSSRLCAVISRRFSAKLSRQSAQKAGPDGSVDDLLSKLTDEEREFVLSKPVRARRHGAPHLLPEHHAPKPYFITTPIYYVNGSPHIGHLYTSVLSDALARWNGIVKRPIAGGYSHLHTNELLLPVPLLFSTGTDEHGSKVEKKAAEEMRGRTLEFCDGVSKQFRAMSDRYGMCYTDFVRTTEQRHRRTVHDVWNKLMVNGDIYKGRYEGWYCVADEAFATEVVKLDDGRVVTADLHRPVEWVVEENYKFRMSKYVQRIYDWLLENPDTVQPPQRYREILAMVKHKLDRMSKMTPAQIEQEEDLSISRPKSRVSWGIDVPGDDDQVIYVWLDALSNYLTVAGYAAQAPHAADAPADSTAADALAQQSDVPNMDTFWPPNVQVIGKDILKFHVLYWPAFLLALGQALPRRFLVHSYWTVEGAKMSKSLGNVINAFDIADTYGKDCVRYVLLREGNLANDSDWSEAQLQRSLSELSDVLGNLLQRCFGSAKLHPNPGESIVLYGDLLPQDTLLKTHINDLYSQVELAYSRDLNLRDGIEHVFHLLRKCNQYFDAEKPWVLARDMEAHKYRISNIKYLVAECLRVSALALLPVMPDKMDELLRYLGCDESKGDYTYEKMHVGARSVDTIEGMQATPPPMLFPKLPPPTQAAAPATPAKKQQQKLPKMKKE